MTKFKVGDTVTCIKPKHGTPDSPGRGGGGWQLGKSFNIVKITERYDDNIYWGESGSGIYENWLKLDEWDDETNIKHRRR